MNKTKMIGGLMFAALASVSGTASASVSALTTIDFETLLVASVGGKPNLAGASVTGMYTEDGMRIGVVNDPLDVISHLHRLEGTATGKQLQYHSDSSGIYMRASDDTAFSLWSMEFHSAYDAAENPHAVGGLGDGTAANDYWDIYGFSDARNPGMLTDGVAADGFTPTDPNTGNPANAAIAHATVTNSFDGLLDVLSLDSNFANIKSFWLHYHGYSHSPNAYVDPNDPNSSAYQFALEIDNVKLNAANAVPAAVPVPAAVWMFGSGLLGLLSFGRKKNALAA